ncbi:MAG: Unknown protein [uncultured Thiotrichaceae bacterium]|uniref:ABC-type transport auxiliary lipoprotein component domain-containing protein n=1 Tax=uncultured Thiotrichaceae bacterium TaxID=298394 RepID=A0A6S6SWV8_9GAMM|nr:MAG: Unknown protein [uncultured Thiotrichaceae bacterium]
MSKVAINKITFYLFMVIAFTLQTGCSEIVSDDETKFYALSPADVATASGDSKLKLGIGPVKISRMISRPQLVVRTEQHQINVLEQHQWGGSLKEEVAQIIIDNLSANLGTEQVEHFPWKKAFKPDYQVRVRIERMDGIPGGEVALKARWWLRKGNAPTDQLAEFSTYRVKTKDKSYPAYVAALSKTLEQLSTEIAKSIK